MYLFYVVGKKINISNLEAVKTLSTEELRTYLPVDSLSEEQICTLYRNYHDARELALKESNKQFQYPIFSVGVDFDNIAVNENEDTDKIVLPGKELTPISFSLVHFNHELEIIPFEEETPDLTNENSSDDEAFSDDDENADDEKTV